MARANYLIDPEMFEYLTQIAVHEPAGLRTVRERTQQMRGWGKILTAECGHFLRFLLRLTGARRCLDVGTFTGFSALSMAVTIPDDGEVHTCEVDESRLKLAKANFSSLPEGSKITTHLGPAVDKLQQLLLQSKGPGYFDFVFIDADKLAIEDYYQLALQLVKENGLIVIDNVFWYKQVVDPNCADEQTQAMRRFNLARSSLPDGAMTIVPLGDGLMLVQAGSAVRAGNKTT
jgi:predicted O-methyltransferase YrrM